MNKSLMEASRAFGVTTDGASFGSGHINSTFMAEKDGSPYILQMINTNVFKNPADMMNNICKVTDHIRRKIEEDGGDTEREVMSVLKTSDGKIFFTSSDGHCFRACNFIEDSISIDGNATYDEFYQAGVGFGRFQQYLADFDADELVEVIERFHDTPERVEHFKATLKEDKLNRAKNCTDVIEYILKYENEAAIVTEGIKNGSIPLRVTHNDTKLNNILFDKNTRKALCVVDLDTVMPGSLLYDFGDAIRYGASTASEDEADLSKVSVDLNLFEAFTKGFVSRLRESITKTEANLLAFSAKLMTYELVVRFLDDYLAGDVYFKTKFPEHNLIRAKNQMKICCDIDSKLGRMNEIIKEILK